MNAAPRPFTPAESAFLIVVPLAWAVLLLFHPTGDGDDFYPVVADDTTPWLVVHVGTLVFVPLMAAAIYLLLRGLEGTAAHVGRLALALFVVFYLSFEVLIGIGTGLFVDEVKDLTPSGQRAGAAVVEEFTDSGMIKAFEIIGTGCLLVALAAAGVALHRRAGARLAVPILLVLAAVPISWHVPPFGQVGLVLFFAAALLVVRGRSRAETPAI